MADPPVPPIPAVVPPSLPPLPSSGGEFYDGVMGTVNPAFQINQVPNAALGSAWDQFPEAMKKYAEAADLSMNALIGSIYGFKRGLQTYIDGLSRICDAKTLDQLDEQIASFKKDDPPKKADAA